MSDQVIRQYSVPQLVSEDIPAAAVAEFATATPATSLSGERVISSEIQRFRLRSWIDDLRDHLALPRSASR